VRKLKYRFPSSVRPAPCPSLEASLYLSPVKDVRASELKRPGRFSRGFFGGGVKITRSLTSITTTLAIYLIPDLIAIGIREQLVITSDREI
jgi:hypothetical protein